MASEMLTLSADDVLCEYVALPAIKGFVTERVSVGPDLLALLIRDGKVAHTAHGAHISVGGVWQGIKAAIGGRHAVRLLIADLKPFPASRAFSGLSRDNVAVSGEVTVELQLNPEKPANVLAFASDHDIVTKAMAVERLLPHIDDRVFQSAVREVDALTLRGDTALQDKIQANLMAEAERIFGDMGLLVRAVSVNWAVNEEEVAAMARRAEAREQDMLDAKLENLQREIQRSAAVTTLQIGTEADIETLKATNDHELRQLVLSQETAHLDAKEDAARVQRMKALEGEIAEIQREEAAKFQLARDKASNMAELKEIEFKTEQVNLKIDLLKRTHEVELRRLERVDDADVDAIVESKKLGTAEEARQLQERKLRGIQNIDLEGESAKLDLEERRAAGAHARQMEAERLRLEAEQRKLEEQRNLSPDQILALHAGLSPEVAAVFAERAKTDARSEAEKREMMERLIADKAQDAAQARHALEQLKETAIGVAGGTARRDETPAATVQCPRCRGENPATAAFCQHCTEPLRT